MHSLEVALQKVLNDEQGGRTSQLCHIFAQVLGGGTGKRKHRTKKDYFLY
jgi:hypothetical protein